MEKCPRLAQKYDEVPNWLRQRLNIDSLKGRGHGRIPPEVKDVIDSILKHSIRDGFELTMTSIEEVMKEAVDAYNEEVTKWCKANEDADLTALDALVQAGASEEELTNLKNQQDAMRASWPHLIACAQTSNGLRHAASKFSEAYGYSMFTQDKPTRHLPRDHPQVEHVNDYITMNIQEHLVDERLVCNFDQVWSCLFEPRRKTLWKGVDDGQKDELSRFPRRQSIRAALQQHFGSTVQLPVHEKNAKWEIKLATIRGYGGANTVNAWRPLSFPKKSCYKYSTMSQCGESNFGMCFPKQILFLVRCIDTVLQMYS